MTEIYGVYAILLLISTSITLYLALYSWNKRLNPDAYFFSFVMVAVSIWSISEAFEMASVDMGSKFIIKFKEENMSMNIDFFAKKRGN